jgi:ketopantoate reductase
MQVLVYGAGPLGSLLAAQLHWGGSDVSILARGERLADLREYGIVLHDVRTEQRTVTHVNVVETLEPEDNYDLVLVVMRKNNALDILPVLAANHQTPNVLFLMNNAAGPAAFVEALGESRVLIGFPYAAGYREGHVVHCLVGDEQEPSRVPFGEVDGWVRERTTQIAAAFESAPGLGAEIRGDMDAWLKYHVAFLIPGLAAALYGAGTNNLRLARTRDLVVMAIRAMREGFGVLQALGYPITPPRYRMFAWLPEPILIWGFQKRLTGQWIETSMVRHADAARDEMKHLADEFLALARMTSVPTPNIERLYPFFDPETPPMPEGSAEVPIQWGMVFAAAGALVAGLLGVSTLLLRLGRRKRKGDQAAPAGQDGAPDGEEG